MSDDNVIGIFDKLSVIRPDDQTSPTATQTLEPYQAAILERPGKRAWSIRIHYSDGVVEQISYTYRKYDLSLRPDRLGISFSTGTAFMTGRNLRVLLDDLQDERIRVLQPFDPMKHKTPKEGDPVIHTIEWVATTDLKKHSTLPSEPAHQ